VKNFKEKQRRKKLISSLEKEHFISKTNETISQSRKRHHFSNVVPTC